MKVRSTSGLCETIEARSVKVFIKRVNATIAALLLIGALAVFSFVYLPLRNALKESILSNFSQVSIAKYHALQNIFQRGTEGARSLSSRTMIKEAIVSYKTGKMDMEELKAYTQSKYRDGAKALENLRVAERFVNGLSIARFASSDEPISDQLGTAGDIQFSSRLEIDDSHIYFIVISPVVTEKELTSYDRLVFDITDQLHFLSNDSSESLILNPDEFQDLVSASQTCYNGDDHILFSNAQVQYHAIGLQDGFYFLTRQDANTLYATITQLSISIFAAGLGILLAFSIAIYLYIVRYAKNELISLESNQIALKKAVLESNYDTLTATFNRRYGENYISTLFSEYTGGTVSPAILLIDIDSLKYINDTYGHDTGDLVIVHVADSIKANIRNEDMLFRWGGDEFVGIIDGLREEHIAQFAGKILKAVSSVNVDAGGAMINAAISIGVSYFQSGDTEYNQAIKRADIAMYRSKAEGGNKVSL